MNKDGEAKRDPSIVWPGCVSGYEIHKTIQNVGEIETYRGYCPGVRRRCVIKKMRSCSSDNMKEFDELESEIKIISQSHHHSLCKYYISFMDNNYYWIIMNDFKYTLADVLKSDEFKDGFEIFEVVTIVSPIFRALAYLHSVNLYHGSVSSNNILFSDESIMLGGYEDKYRDHFALSEEDLSLLNEKQQDDIIDLLIILINLINKKYKEKCTDYDYDAEKIILERNVSKICTHICNILKVIEEDKKHSSQNELDMESIVMIKRIAEVVGKNNSQIENSSDNKKKSYVPLSLKIISEWKKFESTSQGMGSSESPQSLEEGTQNSANTGMKTCSSATSITSKSVNSAQLSTLKEPICVASSSTTATMMTHPTTGLTVSTNSTEKETVNNKPDENNQLVTSEKLPVQQLNNDNDKVKTTTTEPIAQTPEMDKENDGNQLTKLELESTSSDVKNVVISPCQKENTDINKQQKYGKAQNMHIGDVLSFKSVLHNIMLRLKDVYSKQKVEKQQVPRLKRINSKFSIQISNSNINNNGQQLDKLDLKNIIQEQKKDSIIIKVSSPRCCCSSSHNADFDEKQQQQIKKTLPCGKIISVINPKCAQNFQQQQQQKTQEGFNSKIISMDCTGKSDNTKILENQQHQQLSRDISNSSIKKDKKASPIIVIGPKSPSSACQSKQIESFYQPQASRKSIMVATVHNLVHQHNQGACPKSCQNSILSKNQKSGPNNNNANNGKNIGASGCTLVDNAHTASSLPNSRSTTSIQGEKKGRFVIQASSANSFNPVSLQNCTVFSSSASSSLQKGNINSNANANNNTNNNNNNTQREIKNMSLGLDAVQSCNALVSRIGRLRQELSTLTEENNRLLFLYRDLRARTEEESVSGQD